MFHATETHHCQRDTRPSIRHSNRSGTSWRTPFLRLELLSLVSARPVNRLLVVVARQKTRIETVEGHCSCVVVVVWRHSCEQSRLSTVYAENRRNINTGGGKGSDGRGLCSKKCGVYV